MAFCLENSRRWPSIPPAPLHRTPKTQMRCDAGGICFLGEFARLRRRANSPLPLFFASAALAGAFLLSILSPKGATHFLSLKPMIQTAQRWSKSPVLARSEYVAPLWEITRTRHIPHKKRRAVRSRQRVFLLMFWRASEGAPKHGPFPELCRRHRLSTVYFLNTAVNSTRQACQREISRTAAPSL